LPYAVKRYSVYIYKERHCSFIYLLFINIQISQTMPTVTIGDYLLKRLKEINIETIFGVPGDYNMVS
jgi:hypothetical protein